MRNPGLILFFIMCFVAVELAFAGGGGGSGGGGCSGGTSISCGVTYNSSTGTCVGCDPTNNNNNIGQCCYAQSDLDCNGSADVSYSVEDTRGFLYTIPAGVACPTTFTFTITTTANLQGALFNTAYTGSGGGFDGSHGTSDEYGSSPMGSGTFTMTTSGCAGQVIQVFVDGYAGVTGNFSLSVPCPVVLPIELLSFTAIRRREEEVFFQWITASETNNDYFTIERSSDGDTFIPVAKVDGAGTTSSTSKYSYTLKESGEAQYYRLRQTDFNGDTTLSHVIKVEDLRSPLITGLDPVPVKDIAFIKLFSPDERPFDIRFFDLTGRLIYSREVDLVQGENTIQVDLSGLERGAYVVSAGSVPLARKKIFKE